MKREILLEVLYFGGGKVYYLDKEVILFDVLEDTAIVGYVNDPIKFIVKIDWLEVR